MFATDSRRNTPLHLTAKRGFENIVKQLLEHHAPLMACNMDGKTPLELAIEMKHNEVAVVIIKKMEPGRHVSIYLLYTMYHNCNLPGMLKIVSY